jgi:hypothetical protein
MAVSLPTCAQDAPVETSMMEDTSATTVWVVAATRFTIFEAMLILLDLFLMESI